MNLCPNKDKVMESVYVVLRRELREDENDESILRVFKTLESAKVYFHEVVANEKADYMYNQTGSTDCTDEDLEEADVSEMYHEAEDGTLDWHIWLPTSWDELFIRIIRYDLYE